MRFRAPQDESPLHLRSLTAGFNRDDAWDDGLGAAGSRGWLAARAMGNVVAALRLKSAVDKQNWRVEDATGSRYEWLMMSISRSA